MLFRCTSSGYDSLQPLATYRYLEGVVTFGPDLDDFPDAAEFDAIQHGVPAFERARRHPDDLHCGEGEVPFIGHAVGGFIQHTVVRRDGIETAIIHEWCDDCVGKPIAPDGLAMAA